MRTTPPFNQPLFSLSAVLFTKLTLSSIPFAQAGLRTTLDDLASRARLRVDDVALALQDSPLVRHARSADVARAEVLVTRGLLDEVRWCSFRPHSPFPFSLTADLLIEDRFGLTRYNCSSPPTI